MRAIDLHKKLKVIRLFLKGLSYDEISRELGIGKGSVVSIVDEFRAGNLHIRGDMTEYVDALREVAVDLRKHETSLAQVKSCSKISAKLANMGVNADQAEPWLEICQEIASPHVATEEFTHAALELAKLRSQNGFSYEEIISDYSSKLQASAKLDKQIETKQKQLHELKQSYQQEKERTAAELESVNAAVAAARETCQTQKKELKHRLDEYLTQNQLSWKRVNLAAALFDRELRNSAFSNAEMERMAEQIRSCGSLQRMERDLQDRAQRQQREVDDLARQRQSLSKGIDQLKRKRDNLSTSVSQKETKADGLDRELELKQAKLDELTQAVSSHQEDLYTSHLILDFLFSPNGLRDFDLDRLVNLMIALRRGRLGLEPRRVVNPEGKVVCECPLPPVSPRIDRYKVDTDTAKEKFAHLLTPLVKDKFISRFDHSMALMQANIDKIRTEIEATTAERKRHIL